MFNCLKIVFLFLKLSISVPLIGLYAEQINPTRQEMWDTMSADVSHWIDGAGYPIDEEIKDTVIALNLLGIETIASCEGHLDHGLSYPWVGIQIHPLKIKEMMQERADIQEQLSKEELLLKAKFPNLPYNDLYDIPEAENLRTLAKRHIFISESIEQIQIRSLEPLNHLLNQFYENHQASYDSTLIAPYDSLVSLRSVGADRQQIRSQEEKISKLYEYREEMKAFTSFMKQTFMNAK